MLDTLQFAVVTAAIKEQQFITRTKSTISIMPPERIASPTGVGDAFRGGFLSAYRYGLNIYLLAVRSALWQPHIALNIRVLKEHSSRRKRIVSRYRRYFDDRVSWKPGPGERIEEKG